MFKINQAPSMVLFIKLNPIPTLSIPGNMTLLQTH